LPAIFHPVTISSRIAGASAFFLAAALFYAPLAYGCTRPEMWPALFGLLIASIVTGVISFAADRRWPAIPRLVLVCIAAILLQGWWMTWNPVFISAVSANGGLVDTTLENIRRMSFDSMAVTSLLLGSFVVLCELFGDANLRRFVLLAAAISGVLISVIGIVLKLTGEPLMSYLWKPADIDWNDFAFYRYHGNAGAFLNLVWPLILVFTRRAYSPAVVHARKIAWTLSSLACAGALLLNASKASLVIGLLILPWPFATWLARLKPRTLLFLGAATLLHIAGGLFASSLLAQEAAFQRLTEVSAVTTSFDGRWAAYQQYVNALPAAGFFGLGPGLFPLAFPYQASPLGNSSVGLREYAHEDYLQTVLEWGFLGTFWWVLLVAGGLYRAIRTYARRELFSSKTDRHLVLAGILGVCGTLAQALIDFPLQVPSIRLFFLVLLALCWASPKVLTAPPEDPSPRKRSRYRLIMPPAAEPITTSSRSP
jgi:O-antigen ligase